MGKKRFGPWCWYVGSSEDDSEMYFCDSRDDAIAIGGEIAYDDEFYICEARMILSDYNAIMNSECEFRPFAETRNGQVCKVLT